MGDNLPKDVFKYYIYKDANFIIVRDPKHSNDFFHYTIWSLKDIKNILSINKDDIINLNNFIKKSKELNIFSEKKKYFTFPSTHFQLHLHIVPNNYISYRPLGDLYDWEDIDIIYENIKKINDINNQKKKSILLELKFKIGVIIIENIENIDKIKKIKEDETLDYIVTIRGKNENNFVETLINSHELINEHLFIKVIKNNYDKMILNDYVTYI